ncbi:unnamed protein product, partial [Didymodactylos carnosus]
TPTGLYIRNDVLYISDAADNPQVYSMATSATVKSSYIPSMTQNVAPQSVYIDQLGNVYVPDSLTACVIKFDSTLTVAGSIVAVGNINAPGADLSSLDGPNHLTFDSAETYMYIADTNNNRIIRFPSTAVSGNNGTVVAGATSGDLNLPYGVYYDSSADYLYIANAQANTILKWKPFASSGTVIAGVSGIAGSSSTLLFLPSSVYFDSQSGLLYVNDAGNARIMVYCQSSQTGTMIAGTGKTGNSATELNFPYEIAFDSSSNLYVLD